MAHLSIRNIGPIKDIDLELNRINIFIGPQSSGKSTIAKIVSFCQWLEKDCILHQTVSHVDEAYVRGHLFKYHNMTSSFHNGEMFLYRGDYVEITYSQNRVEVKKIASFKSLSLSKNLYVPAERNVLAIPGIYTTKMPDNQLLDFIDNWQIIRTKYTVGADLPILDLHESYYFDRDGNRDMLKLANGKDIPLSEGSSGLQSVTPLYVLIDYYTDWIYNHEEDQSAYARKRYREAAITRHILNQSAGYEAVLDNLHREQSPESTKVLQEMARLVENFHKLQENKVEVNQGYDEETKSLVEELRKLEKTFSHPAFSNLVVEEPELNLFPDTQTKLLYYILSKINHARDSLIITTHSPYILYAVNNCMMASKVRPDERDEVAQAVDIPISAWTDSNIVSVWELDNGEIRGGKTIQDERGLIRGNYFDRVMHNVMAEFHILANYLE